MKLEEISSLDRLQHRVAANQLARWAMSMYRTFRDPPRIYKGSDYAYIVDADIITVDRLPIDSRDAYRFLHELMHAVGFRRRDTDRPDMEELVAFIGAAAMIVDRTGGEFVIQLEGKREFDGAFDHDQAASIAFSRVKWLTGSYPRCSVRIGDPKTLVLEPAEDGGDR